MHEESDLSCYRFDAERPLDPAFWRGLAEYLEQKRYFLRWRIPGERAWRFADEELPPLGASELELSDGLRSDQRAVRWQVRQHEPDPELPEMSLLELTIAELPGEAPFVGFGAEVRSHVGIALQPLLERWAPEPSADELCEVEDIVADVVTTPAPLNPAAICAALSERYPYVELVSGATPSRFEIFEPAEVSCSAHIERVSPRRVRVTTTLDEALASPTVQAAAELEAFAAALRDVLTRPA
jgi:hypothetical protein